MLSRSLGQGVGDNRPGLARIGGQDLLDPACLNVNHRSPLLGADIDEYPIIGVTGCKNI
jgi:hypothetical protein